LPLWAREHIFTERQITIAGRRGLTYCSCSLHGDLIDLRNRSIQRNSSRHSVYRCICSLDLPLCILNHGRSSPRRVRLQRCVGNGTLRSCGAWWAGGVWKLYQVLVVIRNRVSPWTDKLGAREPPPHQDTWLGQHLAEGSLTPNLLAKGANALILCQAPTRLSFAGRCSCPVGAFRVGGANGSVLVEQH